MNGLFEQFVERLGHEPDLRETVLAISGIPYGRPSRIAADAVLDEWRGTCSTKHLLLAGLCSERWPDLKVHLWHRPYEVTPTLALRQWGAKVAAHVPASGLVDVHTFATVGIDGRDVVVDVTFPLADWDGRSDLTLACGPGTDIAAGDDPLATKAQLVATHCDPSVREPFIAALGEAPSRHEGLLRPD